MLMTTLCYLEKEDSYLMLHRVKKEHDINKDKWIGVGGKFKDRESPEDCLLREVAEETGYRLRSWRFRGFLTFLADGYETEFICLYTSDDFEGESHECTEGELCWVKKSELQSLNLWTGDRIFLDLLARETPFFSMKLCYTGDVLTHWYLNGEEMTGKNAEL